MRYYYMLYAIILFTASATKMSNLSVQKQNKILCTVSFIIIAGLLGLRHWSMGFDLGYGGDNGYIQSFYLLNNYSWKEIFKLEQWLNYEKGYIIFNKLIGSIYKEQQFFVGACAILSILPIMITIHRRSEHRLLSVIVFLGLPVFLIYFSGLRQGLAIAVTICSVKYIEQRKKIKFILMVLLASQFHSSAIAFIIAYPLYYFRLNDFSKILCVAAIPIVFIFKAPLFSLFSKIFKDDAVVESTNAGLLFVVFFMLYIFLILFNNKSSDEKNNGYINLFYFACVCQAFGGIYQTAMRVGYYFMIYLCLALPNTIYNINSYNTEADELSRSIISSKKNTSQFLYMVVISIFVWYGLYAFKNSTWAMTYPYYFYWSRY